MLVSEGSIFFRRLTQSVATTAARPSTLDIEMSIASEVATLTHLNASRLANRRRFPHKDVPTSPGFVGRRPFQWEDTLRRRVHSSVWEGDSARGFR